MFGLVLTIIVRVIPAGAGFMARETPGDTHTIYSRIARLRQRQLKSLVFLVLGTSVGVSTLFALVSLLPSFPSSFAFYVLVALFVVGIMAQIAQQVWHVEDYWFQARAVAETAKSLAWEYRAGVKELTARENIERKTLNLGSNGNKPPEKSLPVEEELVKTLKDLRAEFGKSLYSDYDKVTVESEVSDEMKALRDSPDWEKRKSTYLNDRLEDQLGWYSGKARFNKRMSRSFAATAIALELAGLAVAVYAFTVELVPAEGALALVATLVASLVGWSQSRRYAELVEPYTYTGETLQRLKEGFKEVSDEKSFLRLAEDSEHAISREHQMWEIRRKATTKRHLGPP